MPPPPAWLADVPIIGGRAFVYWQSLAADSDKLLHEVQRLLEPVGGWALKAGILLGQGIIELGLSIFIAFFMFRDGASVAERLTNAVERIGGERGKHLLTVAGNTVRGVVYGILGTALVQALMAGIGFLIAGVPAAGLLALLTFFLSVVPVGPPLVWVPASLWLFQQGSSGWGIFMLIWGLGVSSIDNVVKPWLISQGSNMPFLLIFFGALGGALAFGFIGVFIGPTLLAVAYRMIEEWATSRSKTSAVRGGTT
jgi:predicted PurR-regulated permease PerM